MSVIDPLRKPRVFINSSRLLPLRPKSGGKWELQVQRMIANEVRANVHSGVLRGNGLESSCKFGVLTKEVAGEAPVVLERYIRSVEVQLPKGEYQLVVDDCIYKAIRYEVFWSVSVSSLMPCP
jgi:hypothetical protein